MKPLLYFLRGRWTCAKQSGGWQVWPYGKGDTPLEAYEDWERWPLEAKEESQKMFDRLVSLIRN